MRLGQAEEIYESGILSCQSTMRTSNEILIRKYITKRICISVVFTVGFFTMIFGFLLGRFVAERETQIKEIQFSDELELIKELHTIQNSLNIITLNITRYNYSHNHTEHNRKIWLSLQTCIDNSSHNFSENIVFFVDNLVENTLKILFRCLTNLRLLN